MRYLHLHSLSSKVYYTFFFYKTYTLIHIHLGPLGAVKNVTGNRTHGLHLEWERPFSLDLTNVDPDIVYCVDVYKAACGQSPKYRLKSDCLVTESTYAYDDIRSRTLSSDLLEFVITPISNVNESLNGTKVTVKGKQRSSKAY